MIPNLSIHVGDPGPIPPSDGRSESISSHPSTIPHSSSHFPNSIEKTTIGGDGALMPLPMHKIESSKDFRDLSEPTSMRVDSFDGTWEYSQSIPYDSSQISDKLRAKSTGTSYSVTPPSSSRFSTSHSIPNPSYRPTRDHEGISFTSPFSGQDIREQQQFRESSSIMSSMADKGIESGNQSFRDGSSRRERGFIHYDQRQSFQREPPSHQRYPPKNHQIAHSSRPVPTYMPKTSGFHSFREDSRSFTPPQSYSPAHQHTARSSTSPSPHQASIHSSSSRPVYRSSDVPASSHYHPQHPLSVRSVPPPDSSFQRSRYYQYVSQYGTHQHSQSIPPPPTAPPHAYFQYSSQPAPPQAPRYEQPSGHYHPSYPSQYPPSSRHESHQPGSFHRPVHFDGPHEIVDKPMYRPSGTQQIQYDPHHTSPRPHPHPSTHPHPMSYQPQGTYPMTTRAPQPPGYTAVQAYSTLPPSSTVPPTAPANQSSSKEIWVKMKSYTLAELSEVIQLRNQVPMTCLFWGKECVTNAVFVRNIQYSTHLQEILSLFKSVGEILLVCNHIHDRGFVFVFFRDVRDAIRCKTTFDRHAFHGREMFVHFSIPRSGQVEDYDSTRIVSVIWQEGYWEWKDDAPNAEAICEESATSKRTGRWVWKQSYRFFKPLDSSDDKSSNHGVVGSTPALSRFPPDDMDPYHRHIVIDMKTEEYDDIERFSHKSPTGFMLSPPKPQGNGFSGKRHKPTGSTPMFPSTDSFVHEIGSSELPTGLLSSGLFLESAYAALRSDLFSPMSSSSTTSEKLSNIHPYAIHRSLLAALKEKRKDVVEQESRKHEMDTGLSSPLATGQVFNKDASGSSAQLSQDSHTLLQGGISPDSSLTSSKAEDKSSQPRIRYPVEPSIRFFAPLPQVLLSECIHRAVERGGQVGERITHIKAVWWSYILEKIASYLVESSPDHPD
ncbi:hypothetical protein ADUPG1_009474, partial [Aduncisulcus paluster]